MYATYLYLRLVQAEIDARYGHRPPARHRRDSSLEVIRRTTQRTARQELYSGSK
jgi:hypothetical protein